MMNKRGRNYVNSMGHSQQIKDTVDQLVHFVREDHYGNEASHGASLVEQSSQIVFERFALRVFVVDYLMYQLITIEQHKTELSQLFFAAILEQAEPLWDDAKTGLEQRLHLYAHAIAQRPDEPDFAIMMTFCKLCGRTDDAFMKIVPKLLLNDLKLVEPLLRTFISTTINGLG